MKFYIAFLISMLVAGCTSRVALTTHYPDKQEYDLSFGWMLVNEVNEKGLTLKEREGQYEVIINRVLESDPNTRGCSVIKGSFHYFEPGCCAAAKAICQNPIKFEVSEGNYNSEGVPLYIYRVNNK